MEISVRHNGKLVTIPVKETGFISRGIGLTFKSRNTSNLLFDFSKKVTLEGTLTSVFVFFDFLAIWLDKKNNVVDYEIIKPFRLSIIQRKPFYKIVEVPINTENKRIIEFFTKRNTTRR
ncbi:MAG: hypothetical protein ACP5NS_00035 [Candidatus Pacearchaeota archaeon]